MRGISRRPAKQTHPKCLLCGKTHYGFEGGTPLVPTYDYMYFDGIYFRNKMNDEKLYKVARFEIGALYEIGRILAENGIR